MFERVTKSKIRPKPQWISDLLIEKPTSNDGDDETEKATVKETCPKCQHLEAKFHTQQTRGADEGQTCFYTCIKCKHVWTQDN